jgi:hypothetical protein
MCEDDFSFATGSAACYPNIMDTHLPGVQRLTCMMVCHVETGITRSGGRA